MLKKRIPLLKQFWQPISIAAALAVITFVILFMHLGTRPKALSSSEVVTRNSSVSLRTIYDNPLNAPLKVPEHFFIHLRPHGVAASRVASVFYAIAALVLFFGIVRFWQNNFTAILATAMFGTSAWFLHVARLDTPDILLFGVLGLLACALWLKHSLHRNLLALAMAAAVGVSFYIPGLIWLALAGALAARKTIVHELRHIKSTIGFLAATVTVVIAVPMALAIAKQPSLGWAVIGWPSHLPKAMGLVKNLGHIPLQLFYHGPANPVIWLGRLPVLDIFEDAMLVLGVYALWHYRQLDRSKLLLGSLLIGLVLITLGGPVDLTILLPVLYVTIAAGVFYMLESWLKVFPNNPAARGLGVSVLVAAVIISCTYQFTNYFVAWQQSPVTHSVFTQKPRQL